MFDHSIKVPRLYKTASKIAKEVSEGKGSVKQLVYDSKHPNIKALYALVVHTFQKTDDIERLLKRSKLLVKEPRFDPWLAKILITELLWGKKHLQSNAKPIKIILAYEQIFRAHLTDFSRNDMEEYKQVEKPRYVRVNTLKISINEAIEGFREEGWNLKRYTSSNYLDFLDAVAQLAPKEFMIDIHIPYLLIFPPKTQFYKHPAYKNGSIILQDKASCLPVHILNPEPGSTVLDMCAAPGMKTTQCAAVMENSGKIYAFEFRKKRYENLKKIVESSGANCVEHVNADILTVSSKDCPSVDYILVDPSCSGSGITDRVEFGQQEQDKDKNRIGKLAGFQIKILRHALYKFPRAKRIVYSTCSVYPEENEDVVRQVLESSFYFKLVSANQFLQNKWQNFGSLEFGDLGNFCLYSKPDIDLTSGFFVAVFEKLEEGETNSFLNKNLVSYQMHYEGKNKYEDESEQKESTVKVKIKREKVKCERDSKSIVYAQNIKEEKIDLKENLETFNNENIKNGKNEFDAKEMENNEANFHKKKKKKNKADVKPNVTYFKTEENQNNTTRIKTKKKSNRLDPDKASLPLQNSNIDEVGEKKKKKRKNKDNIEESFSSFESEEGEIHKKKKKKKNKEVEIRDPVSENSNFEETAERSTEKDEGNENTNLESDETENHMTRKKKKRKHEGDNTRKEDENDQLVDDNRQVKRKKKKKSRPEL